MSDAEAIVREYLSAVPACNFDRMRELLHAEYTLTSADGQTRTGPDAPVETADMYTVAFPDLGIEITHAHAAGDTVVLEYVAAGTHRGDLMGIAPTGRKVRMLVCTVYEIRDGKIYAEREYMDTLNIMQQLGVMETPATA